MQELVKAYNQIVKNCYVEEETTEDLCKKLQLVLGIRIELNQSHFPSLLKSKSA